MAMGGGNQVDGCVEIGCCLDKVAEKREVRVFSAPHQRATNAGHCVA